MPFFNTSIINNTTKIVRDLTANDFDIVVNNRVDTTERVFTLKSDIAEDLLRVTDAYVKHEKKRNHDALERLASIVTLEQHEFKTDIVCMSCTSCTATNYVGLNPIKHVKAKRHESYLLKTAIKRVQDLIVSELEISNKNPKNA